MSPELRARMMEWLESGSDVQRRHARARLAMPDAAEYPSTLEMAGNAARAAVGFAADGFKLVGVVERSRRMAICRACPHFDADQGRCILCGCVASLKARIASQHCPDTPRRW